MRTFENKINPRTSITINSHSKKELSSQGSL